MINKRIEWLDVTKAIAIFLVILGHVTTNPLVFDLIYSFHMPLFFIISGFLYRIEKKQNFTLKNFKNLIIPFYFYGIISYLYWLLIERKIRMQVISPIKPLSNFMLFNGSTDYLIENVALWFLPCLFFMKIGVHFFITKFNKKNKINNIIVAFLISVFFIFSYYIFKIKEIDMFFMINRIGLYLPFYVLGIILYDRKILNNNKSYKNLIIYITLFLILFIITYKFDNLIVDFILYFVLALTGSFSVFEISKFINANIVNKIGRNTLIILCIHEPIKRIVIKIVCVILKVSDETIRTSVIGTIFISILLLIIMIPFINIINKYFYFTLGKKKEK